MAALHKKIKRHVKKTASLLLYKAVYTAGLTTLIPMVFAFAFREPGPWYSSPVTYLFLSFFLIFFSFLGMLRLKKNVGETLKSLGNISLVPGVVAFIFLAFGKELIYTVLNLFVPGFDAFLPYLSVYLDYAIPKMWILVFGYVIIGVVLYVVGSRLKK